MFNYLWKESVICDLHVISSYAKLCNLLLENR